MSELPADRTALEDIQDELLDRLHAGEPIDRQAVLDRHPAHAPALRRFFALLDVIEVPADPAAAPPGRLGEFEILREIGRGGMGVVYEARQASLNRKVALKVLPPALRRDRRLLARFQREAEAAARLRHPGIVPVYSIGESAGAPFFAMELVEGRSLAEVVRARRDGGSAGLPTEPGAWRAWCVSVGARIADALDYAHGRGILHRDVKPGNILLEADGTPRLTDFGLALDLDASELTLSGEVFGSPLYMSPEQAFRRDQPVDARTDVYSLAVTLYEALTLRLPYHGTSHAELMSALSTGRIVDPRQADPSMPEPLSRVLCQALRSRPSDRYATAAAFAADLRAALQAPEQVAAVARADADDAEDWDPLTGPPPREFRGIYADLSVDRLGRMMGLLLAGGGLAVLLLGKPPPPPIAWWFLGGGLALWGIEALALRRASPPKGTFRERHPTLGHPLVGCGVLLLIALVILAVLSSWYLLAGVTIERATDAVPVQLGERDVDSRPPTALQLAALADGTLADGTRVLQAWLAPDFALRGVVARSDPGVCRFELALAEPRADDDRHVLDWSCALLVDGELLALPATDGPVPLPAHGSGGRVLRRDFPLASVLGEALGRDAFHVRPVITVRVGTRGAGGVTYIDAPATTYVWNGPERTVFVYDEYPADYPQARRDPELDALMAARLQPRFAQYLQGSGTVGARRLRLALHCAPAPRGPVALAMEVALHVDGGEAPLGRASLVTEARPQNVEPGHETWTGTLEFDLAEPPTEAEQRALLALQAGALSEVRLVMRPSRAAALAEPGIDSYWGGEVDVVVPLRAPGASGDG